MARRSILLSLCLAVCLALSAGPAATAQPTYDAGLLTPHLADIGGGRRLNLVCFGHGSPVVVFAQGGEGSMLSWQKVEKPISAVTRVCAGHFIQLAKPNAVIATIEEVVADVRRGR
jgi:hypothetical protein